MSEHKKNGKWTVQDIPLQTGRVAIVTGANSGLGFYTTMALAEKGARIIMACRNLKKGEEARQKILQMSPAFAPEVWHLDLASLKSVEEFALKFKSSFKGLDLLINNAGLMAIPYGKTRDGFLRMTGWPSLDHPSAKRVNKEVAGKLWELSEQLTGLNIPV